MQASLSPQLPLDLGFEPAQTRGDFLVAPCNQVAVHWIDRWPEWPTHALVLMGPAAAGKTHLARVWAEKAQAFILSPSEVSESLLQGIPTNLVIDRADLLVGDRAGETVLFHLYNRAKETGTTLLLTMRAAPFALPFAVPDLASRLRSCLTLAIDEPDDDLLSAILLKLFHDRQLDVSEDVVRFLVPRMERSFAAAQDIVNRADRAALAGHRGVTVQLVRGLLQNPAAA